MRLPRRGDLMCVENIGRGEREGGREEERIRERERTRACIAAKINRWIDYIYNAPEGDARRCRPYGLRTKSSRLKFGNMRFVEYRNHKSRTCRA